MKADSPALGSGEFGQHMGAKGPCGDAGPVLNLKFKMQRKIENNDKLPAKTEEQTQKVSVKLGGNFGKPLARDEREEA